MQAIGLWHKRLGYKGDTIATLWETATLRSAKIGPITTKPHK